MSWALTFTRLRRQMANMQARCFFLHNFTQRRENHRLCGSGAQETTCDFIELVTLAKRVATAAGNWSLPEPRSETSADQGVWQMQRFVYQTPCDPR